MAATLTKRVLPAGLIPAHACDTYYVFVPSAYDGSVSYPLIVAGHGSGAGGEWNGQAGDYTGTPINGAGPGNKGIQITNTAQFGLADVCNQMMGRTTATVSGTPYADGELPAIVIFYHYGNTAYYNQGTSTILGPVWSYAETGIALVQNTITDLITNLGYNIDTSRITFAGYSGGTMVATHAAFDAFYNNRTYKPAALWLGAATTDVRMMDYVLGRAIGTTAKTEMYTLLAQYLKDVPIFLSAGHGDSSVTVDGNFSSSGNSRDFVRAFKDTSIVGSPLPNNVWYSEYEQQSSATVHAENYTWPFFTTVAHKWWKAQKRARPTPAWTNYVTATLKRVPNTTADVLDIVPWELTLDATADTLPGLKSTTADAVNGKRRTDGVDIAVYTDATFATRLKFFKTSDNTTTGTVRGVVGVPASFGVGLGDVSVVVAFGCAALTDDINADGRLAFDWRLRRVIDFGGGTTLATANQSQTVYPDRCTPAGSTLDTFTNTNGVPTAVASPIGGAAHFTKGNSISIVEGRNSWWNKTAGPAPLDSNTTGNAHAVPHLVAAQFKQTAAPTAVETLYSQSVSSSTSRAISLGQGTGGTVNLQHNTVNLVSTQTIKSGQFNFAAGVLNSTSAQSLYLNPADAGSTPATSATNLSAVTPLSATSARIACVTTSTGSAEFCSADIAKIYVAASMNTPFNPSVGLPNADWLAALDWQGRGKNTSYTLGAQQSTAAPSGGGSAGGTQTGNAGNFRMHLHWARRRHRA